MIHVPDETAEPADVGEPLALVVMDEAGNTGENLLDATQPVYALAAFRIRSEASVLAVRGALARTRMPELKFARLKTSNPGRRSVLTLLSEVELTPDDAAVMVVHKPWMLGAKLVDELIEPRMLAKGLQMAWYATGAAKNMADSLCSLAPRALGEQYSELAAAFQRLLRDYSSENAEAFLTALRRARIVCTDERVSELLSVMIDTESEIEAEFGGREDALDPALTALFWQGGHWSLALGEPFEVIHDDSNTVRRWSEEFRIIRREAERTHPDGEPPPRILSAGEIQIPLPDQMQSITFEQSDRDERLQLADVLAGSAAHLYAAASGARPVDQFARDLERAGIGELILGQVGPGADPAGIRRLR
jgi:hypothetical protein